MVDIVAPHLPAITPPGGLIYAPKGISVNIGGHAANVSVNLTQLGQRGVTSVGCVGADMLGDFIREMLRRAGVDPRPQVLTNTQTAKNIALTVEGEDRRFIAELAANTLLSPEHVISQLTDRPRILFVGTIGGLKLIDPNLKKVLKAAQEVGALTFVDVIQPTEPDWAHLTSALSHIDILHLNTLEASLATGVGDPLDASRTLRKLGANTVVISDGSGGLTALRSDKAVKMPAFDIDEVDSTGAGDALCAGMIHSLLRLHKPTEATSEEFYTALLEGQASGAACVTSPGATTAVTTSNVKRLLREQGDRVRSLTLSL
jgi:sugar/nucleoside kinase (ribokinase family)